ncbi:sodium-independent anion transporter [Streptomyces sp. NPDC006415]|uniref:sodium-independent anion transporter n=1 Tax=Streptomyces sp. NPDC006415 TaxID=3155351 RepID=UPI0033A389D3
MALSLVLFIARAGDINLAVLGRLPTTTLFVDTALHPQATTTPGVLAVRPDGNLFFGNAERIKNAVRELTKAADPAPHAVVLDLTASFRLSIPVLDALAELCEELARQGITLHLAHLRTRAAEELARHPLTDHLTSHAIHPTVDEAVSVAARTSH